ncbi:NlpC/P60 family protein [Veillonella atypica]|uniref:NlpC/P60 family protein n=1 Tax=Veillonella atypica TaxID=39777 RepID=UPI002E76F8FF|nr:NlpC/P60 family protein [Veillonella atypica]
MHLTSDMTDMLGTPFDELKCWDVVAEVYQRNGVTLPNYTDIPMDEWQEVKEPTEGSVLVFSLKGKELDHVGVYLGDGRFIHATKPSGVCIEHISKYVPRLKHIYDRKE